MRGKNMPYKDKEKNREYMREYMRHKRQKELKNYSERAYAWAINLSPRCAELREQLKNATKKQRILIEMLMEDEGCTD